MRGKTQLKIIVGPEHLYVKRHRMVSRTVEIGDRCPRQLGRSIYEKEMRAFLAWVIWRLHRQKMAFQRRVAAHMLHDWPGPYWPGPSPDLIAIKPWKAAVKGETRALPYGVVARMLRANPG